MQQILGAHLPDVYVPVPVYPDTVGTMTHIVRAAQHIPAAKQRSVSVKDADAAALGDVNRVVRVNVQPAGEEATRPLR